MDPLISLLDEEFKQVICAVGMNRVFHLSALMTL